MAARGWQESRVPLWAARLYPSAALVLAVVARDVGGVDLPQEPLGDSCQFERLAERPRLFRCKAYASSAWLGALGEESDAMLAADQSCKARECRSYAKNLQGSPALAALVESLYVLFPAEAAQEARSGYANQPLNVLRYQVGGSALWHTDGQEQYPKDLLATAILYVRTPEEGGETSFRKSLPGPVVVPPVAGDLAVFVSCDEVGDDEQLSEHMGMKVSAGRKLVLEKFYAMPRWFCRDGFAFNASRSVTAVQETAAAARQLAEEQAKSAPPPPEDSICQQCLDQGEDYCATWNKCIARAQRACRRSDHVTGSAEFAAGGFSMICPTGDHLTLGRKFLEAKSHHKGVERRASGLMYRVLRAGRDGASPLPGSRLSYHAVVRLINGTELLSTYGRAEPVADKLGDGLIVGFQEALQLMTEGALWSVYVPSELWGFPGRPLFGGGAGRAVRVPPGAALVCLVELLKVGEAGARDDL